MVETGERLRWPAGIIVDKHCVGGLPGNRTTPIIVAIVASLGLTMPKTSSRAITSPAGTADTMETMAPVDLDTAAIRQVVEREGGCVVWGGAIKLSPADDILIRVERALDLDSEGQLIASVLSKKIAAGSTHVVIDLPVGPTAKVRSAKTAKALSRDIVGVAETFGLQVKVVTTDGLQPVGRGIGPALEARDVLSVLRCEPDAPQDLRQRAIALAGALAGAGRRRARGRRRGNGRRGARRRPRLGEIPAHLRGAGRHARAADVEPATAVAGGAAGARGGNRQPQDRAAGQARRRAGRQGGRRRPACLASATRSPPGQPLCTVHAESPGELAYAFDYAAANPDIIAIREP